MFRNYSSLNRSERACHRDAPSPAARLRAFLAGYDWLQILVLMVLLSAGLLFIGKTADVGDNYGFTWQ